MDTESDFVFHVRGHDCKSRVHAKAWVCQGCGSAFTDTEVMHDTMDKCPWGAFVKISKHLTH